MTPQEIRGLAKATCCWLAYKDVTGFQSMLSEATLSTPISELLTSRTTWILRPELQYRKLCGTNELPDFSCDFAASRKYGEGFRFILEAKFLKTKAQNMSRQIAADIIRLALPPGKGMRRYFLLAGQSEWFPESQSQFLFKQKLFDLNLGGGRYIEPIEEISKPEFGKLYPGILTMLNSTGNCSVPKFIYVQSCANEEITIGENRQFKVMIWSVSRSRRLQ